MISTTQSIRCTRERLNRRRRRLFQVLRAMHRGAALHFHNGTWTLSTGMSVDADVAKLVITNLRIAPSISRCLRKCRRKPGAGSVRTEMSFS